MYIPLKREDIKIIPFKGIFESVDKNILNERAHAFEEQYKWAYQCAVIAYECLLKGQKEAIINFKNTRDKSIKGAIINITWNNLLKTSGWIDGFDDKGVLKIKILFNKDSLERGKEECIKDAYNVISHEIMHGHIYWERWQNNQDIDDVPDEYEVWLKIMRSAECENVLYKFAYACYSTYYHEIQAMVSQTYAQVANFMKGDKDKKKFLSALRKTNTYMVYNQNIVVCNKLKDDGGLRNILINQLKNYGLIYDEKRLLSTINNIERKSNNALKAAYNNAYEYVYN